MQEAREDGRGIRIGTGELVDELLADIVVTAVEHGSLMQRIPLDEEGNAVGESCDNHREEAKQRAEAPPTLPVGSAPVRRR